MGLTCFAVRSAHGNPFPADFPCGCIALRDIRGGGRIIEKVPPHGERVRQCRVAV